MKQKLWLTLITYLAYCIDNELYKAMDYLREQVRVLVEHQEKENKRLLLTNNQRMRVAAKAKRLSRKMLERCTELFTPDTIMRWHRKLIVEKYDGSPNRFYAERFVRSVKSECLDHLILSSVKQLEYVLEQYSEYYHHERIHQGVGRIIEPKHLIDDKVEIVCIERLGGLLKSYPGGIRTEQGSVHFRAIAELKGKLNADSIFMWLR